MTPLVAGIALTGKAPMYENVYMSGLKQKAAGEAAAAKQRAKAEEDIEKSINVDPSKYHFSMQNLVKEKASEAVTKMREVMAKDPVRGINAANDIKRDLLIDLAGMSNASNQLFEREKPTYTSTYIRPDATFRALNSKDIREVVKDPAVLQELEDYGWQINVDPNGRVSINFSDIKSFDVRKAYNTFQGDVIEQVAPQLAEKFKVGRTTRQELSQAITKEMSDDYLTSISADPSAVFNWKKQYGVDIRTDDGKQKVYDLFLSPERTGVTDSGRSTYIYNGGRDNLATTPEVTTPEVTTSAEFSWKPVVRDDGKYEVQFVGEGKPSTGRIVAQNPDTNNRYVFNTRKEATEFIEKEGRKTFTGTTLPITATSVTLTIPKGEAFAVGEPGANTAFGEKVTSSSIAVKPSRLESINTYKGDTPKIFGLFRIRKGDVIPDEYLNRFKPEEKLERVYIVAESAPAVNFTGKENVTGATIYIPATKTNLNLVKDAVPTKDVRLIKRIEDIRDGNQKLGDGKIIGAATKGAEVQPQSGFNLLQFDTFA